MIYGSHLMEGSGGGLWEEGGLLCVTVSVFIDDKFSAKAVRIFKAELNKQTHFVRQKGPGHF